MSILVVLLLFAIGFYRPRLWRLSLFGSSGVLFLLGFRVAGDSGSAWAGGTGILRGIRMGFGGFPGCGEIAAWEPLGLLFGSLFLATLACMPRGESPPRHVLVGILSFLGVLLANSVNGILVCWSLLAGLAMWSSADERTMRLPRWLSPGVAALCVGLVFCAVAAYVELDRLFGAHGMVGLFDMGGLARIRHLRLSTPLSNGLHLVSILPLILAGASVSAASMYELSGPFLHMTGSVVGTALVLKVYPLAELGIRDGSGYGVGLVLAGVLVMIWAGFRTAPASRKLSLICCGGATALLGAKMLIGAVAWVLLWAPVIATGARKLDRASVIAVAGSVVLLAPLWQWVGRHGPFLTAFSALAIVAVGVAVPMANPKNWWQRGSVCGIIPLILNLPPVCFSFWPFWTGKIRITATTGVTPWIATTLAIILGIVVQLKGQRFLLSSITSQIDRFAESVKTMVLVSIGPFIDTMSVIWLAAERFLWQGLTLWLPRRVLRWVAIQVDWLQRVPLSSLRRIPLGIIAIGGSVAHVLTASPGVIVAVLAAFLIVVWMLSGVIP